MSQTHVRARVPQTPVKRNYWVESAIFAIAIVVGGYYVQSRLWPDPVENSHETARGRVLETRLALVGTWKADMAAAFFIASKPA